MMDYRMGPAVLEQRPVIDTQFLEAAQEELEKWDAIEWGFDNLLPLVSHVAHLDDPDEDVRIRAHDYLSTILETEGAYPPVAYAFSFVRLESHLNNSLANWEVPSPTISAIFNGEATRLHPEALSCIPDISRATFEEHAAISDTVDLEAQVAHAAYLVAITKNQELDQVTRFRAATKLLSFHVPFFAVRGEKKDIAKACYNTAIQTIVSLEVVDEHTKSKFLTKMDYQPDDSKSQRAAYWLPNLEGMSPYELPAENRRMEARQRHMGKGHVTLRSQLDMLYWFPEYETVLQRYYKVARFGGRLLVAANFMDLPDPSILRRVKNLPEVSIIENPVIPAEDVEAIIKSCDPTFLDNQAVEEILFKSRQKHENDMRRDGTNHYEGHVGPLVVSGVMFALANGRVYTESGVAIDSFHDWEEDSPEEEKPHVISQQQQIEKKYNLAFMKTVKLLTKKTGIHGVEADIEQAERLKEATPEGRASKFRDRKINLQTDVRKAKLSVLRPKAGFYKREIDYWKGTLDIFDEVFNMDPETKALWQLYKVVHKYQRRKGRLPVID